MGHLRAEPTVPPGRLAAEADAGELWPQIFCAFRGCDWELRAGTEDDLLEHLRTQHTTELQPLLPQRAADDLLSVYNEAVARLCRRSAPMAGCTLDRTALAAFATATAGDKVEALTCFSCACIHPYVEGEKEQASAIRWHKPVADHDEGFTFLGKSPGAIHDLIGLKPFLDRYDVVNERAGVRLTDHEDFANWTLQLPAKCVGGSVELLGCPEETRRSVLACVDVLICYQYVDAGPLHIYIYIHK